MKTKNEINKKKKLKLKQIHYEKKFCLNVSKRRHLKLLLSLLYLR